MSFTWNRFTVTLRSDTGKYKITTVASSMQAVIDLVLKDQKAPASAIIDCRYTPLSVSELKYRVKGANKDSYFFNRDTMRYFGDTTANYGVRSKPVEITTHSGNTVLCWVLYRKRPVKNGLQADAYFSVNDYSRVYSKDK